MIRPDVIVTGTGRSGTSTVARILHTHYDICMGHTFRAVHDTRESNPKGEYEDTNMSLVSRRLVGYPFFDSPRTHGVFVRDWMQKFSETHPRRGLPKQPNRRALQCQARWVGCKSPHLSGLNAAGWREIRPRVIVRTFRPKELVVASMNKYRGEHIDWGRFYDEREGNMDAVLTEEFMEEIGAELLHVDFDGHLDDEDGVSDEALIEALSGVVSALGRKPS